MPQRQASRPPDAPSAGFRSNLGSRDSAWTAAPRHIYEAVMKRGMGPGFPKPDAATLAFFESLVEKSAGAEIRRMFGNVAAFVNGNMFAGAQGAKARPAKSKKASPQR